MKIPSIITDAEFTDNGLANTEQGLLVPAYVASDLGFNYPGRFFLEEHFYPSLMKAKVLPLCPFKACSEFLDLNEITSDMSLEEYLAFWQEFNQETIPQVNYGELMPNSLMMIVLMEGHSGDVGMASEIGHFKERYPGKPVMGIRSDIRLGENPAASFNPATTYFLTDYFTGQTSYDDALWRIMELAEEIIDEKK